MSRLLPYAMAGLAGAALWIMLTTTMLIDYSGDLLGPMLVVDAAVGCVALAVQPLRHRRPLAVTLAAVAAAAVSVSALGPALLAAATLATHRRRAWSVAAAATLAAAMSAGDRLYRPLFTGVRPSVAETAGSVLLTLALLAVAMVFGLYLGARRELAASWEEQGRTAERARIAREMHDVLAHRISLVAMHAGALAFREDLDREQARETAQTIRANAHLALAELRQVLGVLRKNDAVGVEPPQPTLLELPALLAEVREAGVGVMLDLGGRPVPRVEESLSRTCFRIVQEALTNARRHAPGAPVTVRLRETAGEWLEVEVSNPFTGRIRDGLGLIGLTERAELAGGRLTHDLHDGTFRVTARFPCPKW
ncbi:sensor histidine kinase [Nonomuraea sp. NPDC050663]|uniref:sensor histidine kinase n=1 Tax=Nonomuraea sp. NPDC050663 TaxID=3364370 RepID=UPI003793A63B